MKSLYILLFLLTVTVKTLCAQWINSINVLPANPTTTDTIYVYADCSFPYGSCDDHTQFAFVNGNNINAGATHCLGLLTFICSYADTFIINPLPAGNYHFSFNLNYGAYPAPCTPGINPGPVDSISFSVSDVTSVVENDNYQFQYNFFPNPVSEFLNLKCKDTAIINKNLQMKIYNASGKELLSIGVNKTEMAIKLSEFSDGIYLCRIFCEDYNEKHLIEIRH